MSFAPYVHGFYLDVPQFHPSFSFVSGTLSILATREWALLILFFAFVLWTAWMPKTRIILGRIVLGVFNPKILGVLAVAIIYIIALVLGLYAVGLWKLSGTAATLFWMMTSALVSVLNFQKAQVDSRYYRKAMLEVFSLTTMFIFLTDMIELSFWFWLLFIPAMTALNLLSANAKLDPAHAAVAKLLEWVQVVAGLGFVYVVVQEAITSMDSLLTMETLRLFGLSAVLSIAFFPFIAVLTVYESYERILGILPFYIPDARLRRAARWRAILTFRTDTDFLERWRRTITTEPPTSIEQVKESFAELRIVKKRERSPRSVEGQYGWSPQSAIRFLKAEGLATNDYHKDAYEPDEWWAESGLTEFGEGPFHNNIAYYVYGTAELVSRLKLKVNVNQPEQGDSAVVQLSEHARVLVGCALGEEWQVKLTPLLQEGESFKVEERGVCATLTKNDWWGGIPGGYDLTLEVTRPPIS